MPKKSFLISHLLFICILCSAQSPHSFSGRVFDAQSKDVLPFATIRLKSDAGKFYGTTSDADGKFSIRGLGAGDYLLVISDSSRLWDESLVLSSAIYVRKGYYSAWAARYMECRQG